MIDEVFREVCMEFGKVFPLEVVEENVAPAFDWEKVRIPANLMEMPEDFIRNVFRHELGHWFLSPRDPDVGLVMAYIGMHVGHVDPWIFANVVADLMVDTALMEVYGQDYLDFLDASVGCRTEGLVGLMGAVYAEHAARLGMKCDMPRTPRGADVHRVLTKRDGDFYERVLHLARLLLEETNTFALPLHFIKHIFVRMQAGGCNGEREGSTDCGLDPRAVAEALVRQGVDPEELFGDEMSEHPLSIAGMFSEYSVTEDPVLVEYRKLRMLQAYLEMEAGYGSEEQRELAHAPWSPGDPPEELDFVRTLSCFGAVVPGVYSLRRVEERWGRDRGGDVMCDCVIVVDCSGSMLGLKFSRVREAVYVIARKAAESGARVGLVPFASVVPGADVIEPTRDVSRITDFIARVVPSGGTFVGPALERAAGMGRRLHIYLITDAEVSDVEAALHHAVRNRGRMTVFIVTDRVNRTSEWVLRAGVKVVHVTPDGLVRKAYEEVKV